MYRIAITSTQLGKKLFPCLKCLEFFFTAHPHHFHTHKGASRTKVEQVTEDLEFIGTLAADQAFMDEFYELYDYVNDENDRVLTEEEYEEDFKARIKANQHGPNKYVRESCSFSSITGNRKKMFVGPQSRIAFSKDITKCVVVKAQYVEIDVRIVEEYFTELTSGFGPAIDNPE